MSTAYQKIHVDFSFQKGDTASVMSMQRSEGERREKDIYIERERERDKTE